MRMMTVGGGREGYDDDGEDGYSESGEDDYSESGEDDYSESGEGDDSVDEDEAFCFLCRDMNDNWGDDSESNDNDEADNEDAGNDNEDGDGEEGKLRNLCFADSEICNNGLEFASCDPHNENVKSADVSIRTVTELRGKIYKDKSTELNLTILEKTRTRGDMITSQEKLTKDNFLKLRKKAGAPPHTAAPMNIDSRQAHQKPVSQVTPEARSKGAGLKEFSLQCRHNGRGRPDRQERDSRVRIQPLVINMLRVNEVLNNQPIVNDVPINQPIVNDVPINQPIVNDVPINQPIVNDVPINQPIVNDVPINQPIVNDVPINQPISRSCARALPSASRSDWRRSAAHKEPLDLRALSQTSVTQVICSVLSLSTECKDFRTACCWLHTSLPVDLRTSVMKEVASLQDLQDTERVLKLILFHLLADVAHICLVVRANTGRNMNLIHKYTEYLLQELESIPRLSLQSLHLDGVWMDRNIISQILRRSPNIRSIQVSGNLCRGVLNFLREEHCKLRSLHLISCTVNDEEVVSALVGTGTDFCTLGNIVCSGGDVTQTVSVALESLRHLTVQSPLVSVCGAMVLLHSLRELRFIQYRGWNSPVSDTLLLLQEVCPRFASFALSSIDLYRPSNKTVENLMVLCPKLQELMIEYTEPNLSSLDSLSGAQQLASLTLRIVSEELIVSAVKAVGKNLLKLKIEFENFTFHPISMETVSTIQEKCPRLQSLEMLHVNVRQNSNDLLPLSKKDLFPELETLILQSSLIQPALLERLIRGNKYLEHLVLDVNQDALTDQLLQRLLSDNDLHLLKIIFLGAGSLSSRSIASLVALPSLSKLSLVLKRFPFISMSTFSTLEANLVKGNYYCVLENVYED
nr:uncharacterized protein LOC123754622 [Procambarus clarkii]